MKTKTTKLPTKYGSFEISCYIDEQDSKEHAALVIGSVKNESNVLVRIHSECLTGDIFGSLRCDCGEQLETSLKLISEKKQGVLIYLRQEGRGIGLFDKLKAYNLQDQGLDTVDANLALGHSVDARTYDVAAYILNDLKVNSIDLLTNNPHKINSLREMGITIENQIFLKPTITSFNKSYLEAKVKRMNHSIDK